MAPALDIIEDILPIRASKQSTLHPFAPLSGDEIKNASNLIRSQWPESTQLNFKQVTLSEPVKAEAVPYIEAEAAGSPVPTIDRKVLVTYYIANTVRGVQEILHG